MTKLEKTIISIIRGCIALGIVVILVGPWIFPVSADYYEVTEATIATEDLEDLVAVADGGSIGIITFVDSDPNPDLRFTIQFNDLGPEEAIKLTKKITEYITKQKGVCIFDVEYKDFD
jgi:hypothetical protein